MKPTKREEAWMRRLEKVLTNLPSRRIGLFTTGDSDLTVYDKTKDKEITFKQDRENADFCVAVQELDAGLGSVNCSTHIHSTCG